MPNVKSVFDVYPLLWLIQFKIIPLNQVPGYPAWYNITYDKEPSVVYTYQLQRDYDINDLEIIV